MKTTAPTSGAHLGAVAVSTLLLRYLCARTPTAANSAELPQRPPHSPVSSSLLQAAAPLLLQYDPGEGSVAAALTVSHVAPTARPPDAKRSLHSPPDGVIQQLPLRNHTMGEKKPAYT